MGIEFELKYRATPQVQQALLAAISGTRQQYRMETTYYDTPEGALSARYYTLRRRIENETSVCTLKFPAQDQGRGEFELECDTIEKAIPELGRLSGTDLAQLTKDGVVPVCSAAFDRTAITFTWQDATLEMALDKGSLSGGGQTVPLCEVEIELKAGSREAARSCGAFLAAAYGLIPEERSKFRRALALAKGE